jgi:hypothetical protein
VVASLLAAIVAAGCVLASLRRLATSVAPTSLDADTLRQAVTSVPALRRLRDAIGDDPDLPWERGLFAAFEERDGPSRDALVNEQLTELDGVAGSWARVPRVCASVATSAGFLLACMALLKALAAPGPDGAIVSAMVSAIDAFSIGIAAGALCAVIHVRARRASRRSMAAIDALVERMQVLSRETGGRA